MIILEGPDGGGKTTLLKELLNLFPEIPVHERASRSGPDGGPVEDLYEWAERDVTSWPKKGVHFYDRHPLVSEYIYGPVIRERMDPRFHTTGLRRRVAHRALTIVCLPPLGAVSASVSAERDMPGVHTRIATIWELYASLTATWSNGATMRRYDYTEHDPTALVGPIRDHLNYWRITR